MPKNRQVNENTALGAENWEGIRIYLQVVSHTNVIKQWG